MLFKIAQQTIKHKWRDLLILFAGLVIATAIFFMFSTIATNEAFLKANTMIRNIVVIFYVGQVLLGIITFVYLTFANRFLVQLRQREYGLLMMFGANKNAVSRLLFFETTLIGAGSLLIGILLGAGFTALAGHILQTELAIQLQHWQIINGRGILITIIFFIIVFVLNGGVNQIYISRTNINQLLRAEQNSERMPKNGWFQGLVGLIGIALLITSFIVLKQAFTTSAVLIKLLAALILNISGTFLTIRSGLSLILMLLTSVTGSYRGLNRFTIGQLNFRLQAFQRILTIVTLLFALALGAFTVGRGYQLSTKTLAEQSGANTIIVIQPTKHEKDLIQQLHGVKWNRDYVYKLSGKTVYWPTKQFDMQPLPYIDMPNGNKITTKIVVKFANSAHLSTPNPNDTEAASQGELYSLVTSSRSNFLELTNKVNTQKFNMAPTKAQHVSVIKVQDMDSNQKILTHLLDSQYHRFPELQTMNAGGVFASYQQIKALFGGLEFMGFFLAIAFLVMLASTLMFKILSNVNVDQRRYHILAMIGATNGQRLRANMLEIGILFAIPLVIGFIDVWYGLQSFKKIMVDAYIGLPTAISVIGGFYLIYYGLTVLVYQRLLRKK